MCIIQAMNVLVLLALVALVAAKFEYTQEFQEWKVKYNKVYETKDLELRRQIIWESNKKFVENHNANADKFGFTVAMNKFADLDTTEFSRIYKGLISRSASCNSTSYKVSGYKVPDTVDWRKEGAVTAIKDQGQCGSCWAFSTTGSLEGQYFLKTKKLVSLSEQQLMDCSKSFYNLGCNGGLPMRAFSYLQSIAGDETEADYPYTAENGVCKYDPSKAVASVTGCTAVTSGDEDALMDAVATVGPISVAIDANHKSFQLYEDGVYYESQCLSGKYDLDHAVLAIGYGTESSDYWLVKNSWGTEWGMDGYIKMSRNKDNNCGIATQASYPQV